ncbi:unnamed protein product [Linum tenue]|uniref:Uncharacterized protein n=1 Tax=Linum tenue TaxID=586396 RepID=A0AAV0HHW1_9ROSI|nr:unnamed protein product [Linum tenue]CAI0412234.1 unnamed protein product [Linum tenue]CAI0413974.1 unnamed protein product [Linum tenue]
MAFSLSGHRSRKGKSPGYNTLVRARYGGWLLYTAASAGDLKFVDELLDREPFLVFGEGEYGVTDMFYAAARGGNSEVFRVLLRCSVSPTGELFRRRFPWLSLSLDIAAEKGRGGDGCRREKNQ